MAGRSRWQGGVGVGVIRASLSAMSSFCHYGGTRGMLIRDVTCGRLKCFIFLTLTSCVVGVSGWDLIILSYYHCDGAYMLLASCLKLNKIISKSLNLNFDGIFCA